MKLLSIQVALFLLNQISRPDLLMNTINEKIGNILDEMPNILNIPIDVPVDLPIAQVKSSDKVFGLNVSRNRVDLFINPNYSREDSILDVYKSYKSIVEKFYKTVLNSFPATRIGIVFTLFEETEEPIKRIYSKYLSETYSANSVEADIRINKQILSKGFVLNNLRNIQVANIDVGSDEKKGVVIQLDTNNVIDQQKQLSSDIISSILTVATAKLKPGEIKELI